MFFTSSDYSEKFFKRCDL